MPIYEYQCQNCGYLFEELQSMSEAPLVKCPNCGKEALKKLIGSGGGIIFKGSGFYQTDYKKSALSEKSSSDEKDKQSEKKEKSFEKTESKSEAGKETKTETKTDTKTETKPESKKETKTESKQETKEEPKTSSKSDKK